MLDWCTDNYCTSGADFKDWEDQQTVLLAGSFGPDVHTRQCGCSVDARSFVLIGCGGG
jgi:hypothetical protein